MSKRLNSRIAALDIGSSKVACFIASDVGGKLVIRGIGHQLSQGYKSGSITNIKLLENSIISAVHNAEQMANETIEKVFVNLSSSLLESRIIETEVYIAGGKVTARDVAKLTSLAVEESRKENRELIHSIPFDYTLDDISGIANPEGMVGRNLFARTHTVTAPLSIVNNIISCLGKCHLSVSGFSTSAYASSIAVLNEDEQDIGATVIDIGGTNTSYATFYRGHMVYAGSIALGGAHITSDISKGLAISVSASERIKSLYGCTYLTHHDEFQNIEIESAANDDSDIIRISKAKLVEIILPRTEEIFELCHANLMGTPWFSGYGGRIVLTGGGSQLNGIKEVAGKIFNTSHIRIGRPRQIKGLADATASAAFATCAGLLLHSWQNNPKAQLTKPEPIDSPRKGAVSRIGKWFTNNF